MQPSNTKVAHRLSTMETIIEACREANMPLGIDASSSEHIQQMRGKGLQIFTIGMDVSYLVAGARETAVSARKALE